MAKILIVEDNEMNRDMLSRRLARAGHEVRTAADGEEGLRAAAADPPDLILMDLSLPGVDGWEATRRLRADEATRAIPVVALTAHALESDRDRALAAGCDGFATKPVDLQALLRTIHELLGSEPSAPAAGPQPGIGVHLDRERVVDLATRCAWSVSEFADFYREGARKELVAIEAALAQGDAETVALLAHGAAGSSATVGLTSLSDLYREVDRCARQEGLGAALAERIGRVVGHLEGALRALDDLARGP